MVAPALPTETPVSRKEGPLASGPSDEEEGRLPKPLRAVPKSTRGLGFPSMLLTGRPSTSRATAAPVSIIVGFQRRGFPLRPGPPFCPPGMFPPPKKRPKNTRPPAAAHLRQRTVECRFSGRPWPLTPSPGLEAPFVPPCPRHPPPAPRLLPVAGAGNCRPGGAIRHLPSPVVFAHRRPQRRHRRPPQVESETRGDDGSRRRTAPPAPEHGGVKTRNTPFARPRRRPRPRRDRCPVSRTALGVSPWPPAGPSPPPPPTTAPPSPRWPQT